MKPLRHRREARRKARGKNIPQQNANDQSLAQKESVAQHVVEWRQPGSGFDASARNGGSKAPGRRNDVERGFTGHAVLGLPLGAAEAKETQKVRGATSWPGPPQASVRPASCSVARRCDLRLRAAIPRDDCRLSIRHGACVKIGDRSPVFCRACPSATRSRADHPSQPIVRLHFLDVDRYRLVGGLERGDDVLDDLLGQTPLLLLRRSWPHLDDDLRDSTSPLNMFAVRER